jgi:Sulfotransferase family
MTVSSEVRGEPLRVAHRIPDFFIVGHAKSGTTALYEMLRHHPGIYMPELKEPRFLASDLRVHFEPTPGRALPRTMEDYLALFDGATPGQMAGEATPSYLRSAVAASAIAALQPDARIIAILREPASFVRSMHLHLLQEQVETESDLRRAFANQEIMREGRRVLRYSDHVRYVEQLRRYHEAFPAEQVLVLIYEDYRRENEATVRRVLRFLDVDDTLPLPPRVLNTAVGVRSKRMHAAVRALEAGSGPLTGALKTTIKAATSGGMRRGARAMQRRVVLGAPPPSDEELMGELRSRFREEVLALSEYLDRDLVTLWGYDRLD